MVFAEVIANEISSQLNIDFMTYHINVRKTNNKEFLQIINSLESLVQAELNSSGYGLGNLSHAPDTPTSLPIPYLAWDR